MEGVTTTHDPVLQGKDKQAMPLPQSNYTPIVPASAT